MAVEVSFGRYFSEDAEESRGQSKWRRREVQVVVASLDPFRTSKRIDLGKEEPDAEGAELHVRTVSSGGIDLVTVSLINNARLPDEATRTERESHTFFQTRIVVRPGQGTRLIPKPPRRIEVDFVDDRHSDEKSNALLFRNAHEFAVGHVCSADWTRPHDVEAGQPETAFVATSWVPSAIVPSVSSSGHTVFDRLGDPEAGFDVLDARFLSEASPELLHRALSSLCDAYEEWIEGQDSEGLPSRYAETARKNLDNCQSVLDRLRDAADVISWDERLRTAFQLANLAMLIQHDWDPDKAKHGSLRWRPFQVAFIMLSAPSTAMRSHPDRNVMDLLWFPTGGGKTEAYLGLIALIAFHRRLSAEEDDSAGEAAMMRYTLRLLTTQQFARSAAMIMACEAIRRGKANIPSKPVINGDEPFSIGLWVGGEASPNRRAEAFASLGGARELASPKQLAICPCCRTRLTWPRTGVSSPIQPVCEQEDCELAGPLPVWTVDEDVYDRRPTLLVGTIDKFAQIVRRPEITGLFASSSGRPPDLILQDELHLISGPLGTLAGLYESAIDLMFSTRGQRPKIIGSTATIKRASEQVLDLFDRRACQFPPTGIDEEDSGFATKDPEAVGRRYVGITTAGRSAKFALQAVAGSLLQSAEAAFASDKERDPYQTLVGYFNSIRELGGALVLMQDDVGDTISLLAQARGEDPRKAGVVEELTSRRTQDEILGMLSTLAIRAGRPGCVDTVLATNMVSVGVDIPQLGLMLVNGQPKTTAEYIQSTSRVGRGQVSGLVVTILNNAKARDRSHFETFRGWHGALYRDVEATSVTPFASRARDRALHATLVAAVRHLVPGMLDSPAGAEVHESEIRSLIDRIVERAKRIDPEENEVRDELIDRFKQWVSMAPRDYWNEYQPRRSLLQSAERNARDIALGRMPGNAWPTLNSMRNVEAGTPFRLAPALKHEGRDK
ncbi:MAG: helicase-related protein [Gammaproteobacteria bacterium]|nr:helicase-related protein [Gammaproteobacteria bacterium]